ALVGVRALDAGERELLRSLDARVYTMSDVDRLGVERAVRESLAHVAGPGFVHVSLDMDALDPDVAPGVGTPVRGGLSYRDAPLACVYTLEGDPVPERLVAELARPDAHLALGRFENHFVGGGDATWPLHKAFTFVDAALATSRGTFATGASGAVYAAFVPYSGT